MFRSEKVEIRTMNFVFMFLAVLCLEPALALAADPCNNPEPKDGPYDVLDGKGRSKVTVDAIGFEKDVFELRIKPKGALKRLGVKYIKKKNADPVLATQYCFNNVPYRIIRRPLLTMGVQENFKAYLDPNEKDEDHIIFVSNPEKQPRDWPIYPLGPAPTRVYPDHAEEEAAALGIEAPKPEEITPSPEPKRSEKSEKEDGDGNIKPFQFK